MRGYSRRSPAQMDGLLDDIVPKVISIKLTPQTKKELAIGGAVFAVGLATLITIAFKISD